MTISWVDLCVGCWAGFGLYGLILLVDRAVYAFLNSKKPGEKPEKFEEE